MVSFSIEALIQIEPFRPPADRGPFGAVSGAPELETDPDNAKSKTTTSGRCAWDDDHDDNDDDDQDDDDEEDNDDHDDDDEDDDGHHDDDDGDDHEDDDDHHEDDDNYEHDEDNPLINFSQRHRSRRKKAISTNKTTRTKNENRQVAQKFL